MSYDTIFVGRVERAVEMSLRVSFAEGLLTKGSRTVEDEFQDAG